MNDDTLILYYYNDGLSEQEREDVAAALRTDAALAAQYSKLCGDLDHFADEDVGVPSHVVQRMHDSIDRVARPVLLRTDEPRRSFSPFSFAWGAAVTAALAIGIGIGFFLSPEPPVDMQSYGDPFTRGMQVYLQDARADLAAMPIGEAEDRADLIMHIVEQNRLFEQAAVQNDSQSLARVLRAFEPVLLKLATEDLAPEDAQALRAQLEFELNVMLTKLSRASSNETQTT